MPARPARSALLRVLGLALVASGSMAALALPSASPALGSAEDLPRLTARDYEEAGTPAQLLKQPGGHTFRATISPATEGGLLETLDGYSVDRDKSGVWRYVTGRDAQGDVVLSRTAVSAAGAPAGLGARAGRAETDVDPEEMAMRAQILSQLKVAALQAQRESAAKAGAPRKFYVPALMFATWYDESKGQTMPQFKPGHDRAYFANLLNGFGGNPQGSMTQFYFEASFGQFLVVVDVFGVYTSLRSIGDPCYYGDGNGEQKLTDPVGSTLGLGGLGALGMAVEAVPQANVDPAMDWSRYDNDGDGKVDFTMIIHSGYDHAATGAACDTHSHAIQATLGLGETAESTLGLPFGTISRVGIPTDRPGVFVDRIVTIPEAASKADPLTIGVAAHEMAHAVGEPDYYDTSYSSVGTGDFDMMAGGSYLGAPSGSNPSMMSPATRVFQGWVTPKVVNSDLRNYTLRPRTTLPSKGYQVGRPDPNLLLVPTYEIREGQTDKLGHTWLPEDVYGLAKNPKTGKYIVEGFYVENVSRNTRSVKLHPKNPMGSMFDRKSHGSGLMVWHFDYWRQSTTYFGHGNDAQNDPNRYQMDIEEFDQNDNTQEIQLNYSRGNPSEYLVGAATGITSGTAKLPPRSPKSTGKAQKPIEISGVTTPATAGEATFTLDPKANNSEMQVSVNSDNLGDCKLELFDSKGKSYGELDSGGPAEGETATVRNPVPGEWRAVVADFAACGQWSGRVIFEGGGLVTSGSADTWSNWSERPTGWAFTNVSGFGNGLDISPEGGNSNGNITLDVVNLQGKKDVSPGFVTGKLNASGGSNGLNVGRRSALEVPIFSNGSKGPGKVDVVVREGSAQGRIVARRTVDLKGYQRSRMKFSYTPRTEGPVRLVTVVDPRNRVQEAHERNQAQVTNLWAGPRAPRVLVVDDDQVLANERAVTGALAALGVPYSVTQAHPTAGTMKKYAAVIWEASVDRHQGQLDKFDRAELRTYLDRGGRLFITSNRIFDALGLGATGSPQGSAEAQRFGAQYLGFRIPEGNTSYVVTHENPAEVTGGKLLGKGTMSIQPPPARPFVGLAGLAGAGPGTSGLNIKPFGKARGIATLDKKSMIAVQRESDPAYLGVSVDGDKKHRRFKTVTLGWNLGSDSDAADSIRIVGNVLRHFGVKLRGYSVRSAAPVVYHASVRDRISGTSAPVTAIVLGGRGAVKPTLHFRRHNQGRFYVVPMQRGKGKGVWRAVIPGRAVTPDGVDYFIRAGATTSPYGATGGPLYHSIGVAAPNVRKPLPVKR